MFAAITPALITGAFAERKRFGAFVTLHPAWSILVYSPLAHWVWAPGGWLRELGALDFAGGTVVHISSGVSALVAARPDRPALDDGDGDRMEPHDVPMTVLGAGLLWFGWFGFNAGSALAANGLAANALLVTNTAAGGGDDHLGLASVRPQAQGQRGRCGGRRRCRAWWPSLRRRGSSGPAERCSSACRWRLCYGATLLRERLRIDDALDVFAVHGVGGMLGAVATGVLAVAAIGGVSGAIEGNLGQVWIQLVAVGGGAAFSAGATFVIVKGIEFVLGLRVEPQQEELGLDLAVHGEVAYQTS